MSSNAAPTSAGERTKGEASRWKTAEGSTVHSVAARSLSNLGQEFAQARDVFSALGDENRQLILLALLDHYGGMRVGEIAGIVGLSRPAVSHHLKILKDAKLVGMYSVGTRNFYHVSGESSRWRQLATLAANADAFVRDWNEARMHGMEPPYRKE